MSLKPLAFIGCLFLSATVASAQDEPSPKATPEKLTGTWHCRFETPFGLQTYHIHVAIEETGDTTARAEVESRGEERRVQFVDVKVESDTISFAEVRQFGEREFRIEYKGELRGKGLVLGRAFGERGAQE